MRFLDKQRAGALAVLAALLCGGALFLGSGAAKATFSPCNDGMGSNDHLVDIDNNTFVGVEAGVYGVGDQQHQYYCFAATGGEANQSWVKWELWPGATPGYTADVYGCFTVVIPGCTVFLDATGAHVDPVTTTNVPGSGTSNPPGTGASVGNGPGTCVYADGSSTCPGSLVGAGATIAEDDVRQVPGKTAVDPNASSQKLVTVTVGPTTVSEDVPTSSHCIGIC